MHFFLRFPQLDKLNNVSKYFQFQKKFTVEHVFVLVIYQLNMAGEKIKYLLNMTGEN